MSTRSESASIQTSLSSMSRLLYLPNELLQSIFGSIANFEPWTYTSTPDNAAAMINDEESELNSRDTEPIILTSIHRVILGLSSEDGWLVLVLSRHPYHLSRSDRTGISAVITQALRRMNSRLEQSYWSDRDMRGTPSCHQARVTPSDKRARRNNAAHQTLSMKQYHASVHPEGENCFNGKEIAGAVCTRAAPSDKKDSTTSVLIVHRPIPVLKITGQDLRSFANPTMQADAVEQISVLLVAILILLVQCRMTLLENHERLERDTPISSIEPSESRDSASPKMSPRHDRLRSMSGSTVAESMPHGETLSLSFSTISTVYNSSDVDSWQKEVRWVEKRVSEETDLGASPKRPKLSEYKQVSSGRVATLMDRFEKFHL